MDRQRTPEQGTDELVLDCDGVELCVETFGRPADPTVLLVAGGAQSMVWWEAALCERIAGCGRHVVRYDHRDTGRSTTSPVGAPAYTAEDLATDPLRILDALDVDAAHVVGMSMGGGIAQHLAVHHPSRVRTLTLVSTSPDGPGDASNGLPPIAPPVMATFTDPDPEPDWSDRESVLLYRVDAERAYVGSLGFDEERVRRLAAAEIDRTRDMAASMTNHFLAEGGPSERHRLGTIAAPTLVLHGTDDPLFPIGHGEALAREIPGARLVPLPGVGHEIPPPSLWDVVVTELVTHPAG